MAPLAGAQTSPNGGRDDDSSRNTPHHHPHAIPSSLLRECIARVRTSTTPPGLYCTQNTAQLCSLVCRDWCDSVLAEARTLRVGGGSGGGGGGVGAASMDRLSGLRLVEVRGDGDDDEDTGLTLEYVRSERARWRQVVVLTMRGAPRRFGRLIAALPPPAPATASCSLPALAELTATGLPPSLVAELSRLLTRDHFPALKKLTLTLVEGCLSPLDCGDDGDSSSSSKPPPPPPPIFELSVLGPPIPLGPPSPNATRPQEDAALNLEACATVTPRLLRALAPTLRALTVAVSPSRDAAVLVEAEPPKFSLPRPRPVMGIVIDRPVRRRQLVPLEALAPWFAGGGKSEEEEEGRPRPPRPQQLALSRLTLYGDLDLTAPDPHAPVPTPASRLPQAQQQHEEGAPPPVLNPGDARFEEAARKFYAAGRYAYARRRRGDQFEAVIEALAPSLEALRLLPSLDDAPGAGSEEAKEAADAGEPSGGPAPAPAPPRRRIIRMTPTLLLGPDPGLEPRARLRAWLPECLAGFTRLTELTLADGSIDAMRPPPRSARLSVSRATTGSAPPALRRLTLGGVGGPEAMMQQGWPEDEAVERSAAGTPLSSFLVEPLTLEGDAFSGLPSSLEALELHAELSRPALPRCLLDGRMPGLKSLDVAPEAARGDAALLSTLDSRARVRVTVGGEAWEDWYAGMRYEGGAVDDDAGSGWSGDGDHWAADYAAGSD